MQISLRRNGYIACISKDGSRLSGVVKLVDRDIAFSGNSLDELQANMDAAIQRQINSLGNDLKKDLNSAVG